MPWVSLSLESLATCRTSQLKGPRKGMLPQQPQPQAVNYDKFTQRVIRGLKAWTPLLDKQESSLPDTGHVGPRVTWWWSTNHRAKEDQSQTKHQAGSPCEIEVEMAKVETWSLNLQGKRLEIGYQRHWKTELGEAPKLWDIPVAFSVGQWAGY